jgi:5-methylcytosine-specific restriction protein A
MLDFKTTMSSALYINGVFETVLKEIVTAQKDEPGKVCYLQPYSAGRIKFLVEAVPAPSNPIRLYISLTDSLSVVSYRALIVGWHDKRELSATELNRINKHIKEYQPGEKEVYFTGGGGQPCVNLISITHLEQLPDRTPVSSFVKVSDGTPLKKRSRSGGWSPVEEQPAWAGMTRTVIGQALDATFEQEITQALMLSSEDRKARLEKAPKRPEPIQVISRAFRRNADVAAEVLLRAKGSCEGGRSKAPFLRASDGSPYLEVHHRIMLAHGGEDTVENAIALCPNCHRQSHFGTAPEQSWR